MTELTPDDVVDRLHLCGVVNTFARMTVVEAFNLLPIALVYYYCRWRIKSILARGVEVWKCLV